MDKIKVIAHRGANKYAPQNTLPAFKKAVELHTDGFETDVHVTKDGVLVLCHNYTIDETSNGKGKISDMTFEEIRSYDFGSYCSDRFAGTKIPTLEELLTLAKESDIEILNLELKSPKEGETDIVRKTLDMVRDFGLSERLILSSFDPTLLIEAKQIDHDCETALIYSPDKKTVYKHRLMTRPFEFAASIGCSYVHPITFFVNPGYVQRAHDKGLKVNVWTADYVSQIEKMIARGVDGIITDLPDVAAGIISKYI